MISPEEYRLFVRCPRSLHRRLSGERISTRLPVDDEYPVRSERSRVVDVARAFYAPLVGGAVGAPRSSSVSPSATASASALDLRVTRPPYTAVADIVHPQKPDGSAAVLVRDATSIKESYLVDAALVRYCWPDDGPLRIYICHVNKQYERRGAIDPSACLSVHDVTRRVTRFLAVEMESIERLAAALDADPLLAEYADVPCDRPSTCPVCGVDLPEPSFDHVSTLYRGGRLVEELADDGFTSIVDVPTERLVHQRQKIQQHAVTHRVAHVNHDALARFADRLEYPLLYLDFEATSTAIPPYECVRPWEHVPYLFSLHREEEPGGALHHESYIMRPGHDDRDELVVRLCAALAAPGSVIVYSAGFERGILRRLAEVLPHHAPLLDDAIARIVDLLEPFNEFSYYHHEQRGKVSLKTILPILTDKDYGDLAIRDGYTANLAYRYLTELSDGATRAGSGTNTLLGHLVDYCTMDTLAMVHIVSYLRGLIANRG